MFFESLNYDIRNNFNGIQSHSDYFRSHSETSGCHAEPLSSHSKASECYSESLYGIRNYINEIRSRLDQFMTFGIIKIIFGVT